MMTVLAIVALIGPNLTALEGDRFEVALRFDDLSVQGNADAFVTLTKAATKYCKGKGNAATEGALRLNQSQPIKERRTLELKGTYRCVPKR